MRTVEIPRAEWVTFFDGFSRQHEGWLVTLEVFGPDIGAQVQASAVPLQGVVATLKGTGLDTISIIVGESADEFAHTVTAPIQVMLEQTEEGAHVAVEIQAASEEKTLLRFRSVALPEMVDGVVLE